MGSPDGLGGVPLFPMATMNKHVRMRAAGDQFAEDVPEFVSEEMAAAMAEDVVGSGIFDDKPNVHLDTGIFEDHWALPGYAAREDGAGKSEVIDRQTGTPIEVYLPGTWTGQQFMPSTQPRYPYPDPNPQYGNWGVLADRYDLSHQPGSENIAIEPIDLGLLVQRVNPPAPRAPATLQRPVAGLGGFETLSAAPTWQWAVAGLLIGVAGAFVWDEFGGSHGL
jgi:hypothetical protein